MVAAVALQVSPMEMGVLLANSSAVDGSSIHQLPEGIIKVGLDPIHGEQRKVQIAYFDEQAMHASWSAITPESTKKTVCSWSTTLDENLVS